MGFSGNKCIYINCGKTQRKCPGLHMFRFPLKDKERCKQWIINSGVTAMDIASIQLKFQKICEYHFEGSAFINPLKKRLIHSAVPIPYEDLINKRLKNSPLFEQVYIVTESFEESPPPTILVEEDPLILKREKNAKTY